MSYSEYRLRVACCVLSLAGATHAASPLGAGFTYQGQLKFGQMPLNGTKTLRFSLWDAQSTSPGVGGNQLGSRHLLPNVPVSGGTFTVTINSAGEFGPAAFNGDARFLQIEVCEDAGCGTLATLSPRQVLSGTPYALGPWQSNAGNLVYTGGNVGIGTDTPAMPLDVRGPLQVVNTGDQAEVLWLGIERSWAFKQQGTGAATALKLESVGGGGNKDLLIQTTGNVRVGGSPAGHLTVASDGKVGVGTASPQSTLDVNGPVNSAGGYSTSHSYRYVGSLGEYWRLGARGVFPVCAGANIEPFLAMRSPYTGNVQVEIYRDCMTARGVIVADEKHFRVPNPADPTTDIWYCSIEGPEAAMYVRGTSRLTDGRGIIELPDHFRNLACEAGMTVQVTPLSADSRGLAVVQKKLTGIEIRELGGGTGTYEYDWRVEATRRGHENYEVIRPWKPSEEDKDKAWQSRVQEIEERRSHGEP